METKLFSQSVHTLAKSDARMSNISSVGQHVSDTTHIDAPLESTTTTAKKQLNAAILQSVVDVNASSNSLSLTFKAAIEGINDALKETLGDNAIQHSYDSGVDVSPDATAERIVSLSSAFFGSYQEQHPELSQEESLTSFVDIISGGINTGFDEARNILSGLQVLEGGIASNIDLTYDLVQQKLTAFTENVSQTAR